jgi:hypothetical protein
VQRLPEAHLELPRRMQQVCAGDLSTLRTRPAHLEGRRRTLCFPDAPARATVVRAGWRKGDSPGSVVTLRLAVATPPGVSGNRSCGLGCRMPP